LAHRGERKRRLAARLATGIYSGDRHVVEALRHAGTDVEDTGFPGVIQEKKIDIHAVFHRDEVAPLLAVAVAPAAGKQSHMAGPAVLVEEVINHGSHPPLVLLALAIDVEIAQSGDLGAALLEAPPHQLVEEELRIPVDVERGLALARLAEFPARAVERRRRRVDQMHRVANAIAERLPRVRVLVLNHVA